MLVVKRHHATTTRSSWSLKSPEENFVNEHLAVIWDDFELKQNITRCLLYRVTDVGIITTITQESSLYIICSRLYERPPEGTSQNKQEAFGGGGKAQEITEIMDYEANGLARIQSTVRLALTLHETACVRLEVPNSSYSALHVITFSKLEQHHPVSEKYIFAIPLLSTSCFCDCAGGTKACSIEGYKHRKCRQGVLCYNTYHSAQSSEDCGSKQKSEACCWIRLDIYENRTYEALLLGQADTFAEFKYSLYEWTGDNWKNSHREDFAMLLNRGHAHARSTKPHRLEMFITSRRAFRDVKPGMYYVDEGGSDVCGYVPMNKADEASLEKLGWLQYHGSWDIRRGSVKMQQAHNVHFKSCKAQTYINDFDAEYLVLHMDNNSVFRQYHMGKPLSSDPWVHSARYGDRTVIVQLEDAGHVELTIFAETIPKVIRHSSRFEYFEGSTQMDERSNRFLNISFFEARGTILGNVYLNNTRTGTPEKIRVYVGSGSTANFTTLISISSSVNGSAYVCFHPDGDLHGEQCRWLPFRVKNYEEFHPNAGLHGKKGMSFPGLNQEEDDMWTKIGSFAESLLEQLDAPTWRRRMKLIIAIALLVVVVTVACCASKVLHWAKKCCLCILPVARTR